MYIDNPELIESSFNHNYERYQINGDKNKELSLNDYLYVIKKISNKRFS